MSQVRSLTLPLIGTVQPTSPARTNNPASQSMSPERGFFRRRLGINIPMATQQAHPAAFFPTIFQAVSAPSQSPNTEKEIKHSVELLPKILEVAKILKKTLTQLLEPQDSTLKALDSLLQLLGTKDIKPNLLFKSLMLRADILSMITRDDEGKTKAAIAKNLFKTFIEKISRFDVNFLKVDLDETFIEAMDTIIKDADVLCSRKTLQTNFPAIDQRQNNRPC